MFSTFKALVLLAGPGALAGTVLWDGSFNSFSSSTDLNAWSFANQVGPYQYYIHGSGTVTKYVNLSPSYKNPADTYSKQGVKMTIDGTSFWNGQTMRRTELIPQTKAAINSGHVYYHFSLMHMSTNPPSIDMEHQVNFFESHFTEMKYGWITGSSGVANPNLQWVIGGKSQYSMAWPAATWVNVAYDIDFTAGTCALYLSEGASPLALKVAAQPCKPSSNGADWHLGVLRLPRAGYTDSNIEDWYFSGVYVESGPLTTSVAGPHTGTPQTGTRC